MRRATSSVIRRALQGGAILLGLAAVPAWAAIGDWWILPIDRLDGSFTTHSGAGLDGSDAVEGNGVDSVRRVWWDTNNVYQSSPGATFPTDAQLFTVESWGPTAGSLDWQPIETQYNGYAGDAFPIEPNIPWNGAFGTNHQWLGAGGTAGAWTQHGPGPQGPDSEDPNAGPGGDRMWMTGGSVLYAKWDYPFAINRSWSMVRITQTTGVIPEPGTMLLASIGLVAVGAVRRRRQSA